MEHRLEELEKKVAALTRAVEELQAKLGAGAEREPVRRAADEPAAPARERPPREAPPESAPWPDEPVLPLVGRTLLSFAGAFVIRALTDGQVLAGGLGVGLGLLFGTAWVALAWRDTGKGRPLSATFHGVAAALITYPLVIETASRLAILPAAVAAVALSATTLALVVTGWHGRLPVLAWFGVLGAGTAATVLRFTTTESSAPFHGVLWAVAFATVVLADGRHWTGARWPIAVLVDGLLLRDLTTAPDDATLGAALPMLSMGGLYVASLAWRSWVRRQPVTTFDVLQTLGAVSLALAALSRAQLPLDLVSLGLGAGALATAAHLGARTDREQDGWFYGLVAVSLGLLAGVTWKVSGIPVAGVWAALALGTAVVGRWRSPLMMWSFSAVFSWAMAAVGGLLSCVKSGLLGTMTTAWSELSAGCVASLGVVFACYLVMTLRLPRRPDATTSVTTMVTLVLVLLSLTAAGAYGVHQASSDAAVVIISRTLLLIGLAIGAVFLRRLGGPRELAWSAAFLLGLCGLKLVVQDLPNGNAVTLVVGFLALGLTITVLPRALRARGQSEPAPTAATPAPQVAPAAPPTSAPAPAPDLAAQGPRPQ